MKPNNLDNQFKEKLNKREIAPSENSWDRLNAMLTVAETKKPKRNFGWLYIAAIFIGFVLITSVFLSQTDELIDVGKNPVVQENLIPEPLVTDSAKINKNEVLPIVKKPEIVSIPKRTKTNKREKAADSLIQEEDQIAVINPSQTIVFKDTVAVSEQIASVEIEKPKPTVKVDAKNLLSQVNGELDVTFREKVIYTVNKNYQSVKVALAKRNQE